MSLFVFNFFFKGNPGVVFFFFNYCFCNATILDPRRKGGKSQVLKAGSQSLSLSGYPVFLPLTCRRLFFLVDLKAVQSVCVRVFAGFYCCVSKTVLGVGADSLPGLRADATGAPAGVRTCPSSPSDWPGRRRGSPGTATHPRTLSAPGPRRLPGFYPFSRSQPVPPRPGWPGRAGSAALRFRLAAGRKPKGGARGWRAAMHIHQVTRGGGGGSRPEWVWRPARCGRPSRVADLGRGERRGAPGGG